MLDALGFATTAVFRFAIMTERPSASAALIPIPAIAGLLAGAGPGLGSIAEACSRGREPAVVRWRRGARSCRTNGGRPRTTPPEEAL
jgi:hypothetical protein